MSRKKTKTALAFEDAAEYKRALGVLQELDGWVLPGRNTIVIDAEDKALFEERGLVFVEKPIVSVGSLPIEERQRIRGEMWPHMKARSRV